MRVTSDDTCSLNSYAFSCDDQQRAKSCVCDDMEYLESSLCLRERYQLKNS